MVGNYNIVNNNINFVAAPFGKIPVNTTGGDPELRDFTGLTTSSTFQGRVFLRTALSTLQMRLTIITMCLMISHLLSMELQLISL